MNKRIYITKTENLRYIRPAIWMALAEKFGSGFKGIGLEMPADKADFTDEFWKSMAKAFKTFDVDESTADLAEFLDDMDAFFQPKGIVRDTLLAISEEEDVEKRFKQEHSLEDDQDLTLNELAAVTLVDDYAARRIKAFRSCLSVDKSAFRYFACPAKGEFHEPSQGELDEMADRFKTDLKKELGMKDFCRIDRTVRKTVIQETDENGSKEEEAEEWWFSIQRASRTVVSPSITDGDIKTVKYTPPTTDIVVLNPRTRTLSTNVAAHNRRMGYLREFLQLVLPCAEDFKLESVESYTLKPLEKDGWEALFTTEGNDELRLVRLKEVRCQRETRGGVYQHIDKAPSKLSLAEMSKSCADEDKLRFKNISQVRIEFVFSGESSSTTVARIMSGSQIAISRKIRKPDVMKWLRDKGFVNTPAPRDESDDEADS